ncbi:hypothetical protein [Actinomadura sp. WMMA1423]|uniref:hypothetical protein n=1 Tax=Actinomadura sp. WMMA1423 TaxID=2591108 RepID=UPI001146D580|nr:hypothetical protein [Actinomadura sp. WMMA1423]
MAIRSSGLTEGSPSLAASGANLSVLGDLDLKEIRQAIRSVREGSKTGRTGVIVQVLATPLLAGVATTADPISFKKGRILVDFVRNKLADGLLSGKEPGERLIFEGTSSVDGDQDAPIGPAARDSLLGMLTSLEKHFNQPLEVEWVLAADGKMMTVQVRPLVLPAPGAYTLNELKDFAILPDITKGHSKIELRRRAAEIGVRMSPARVDVATDSGVTVESKDDAPPSSWSAGLSVVLLYPPRVDSQIVRKFSPSSNYDVELLIKECQRYAIRSYPTHHDVGATRRQVLRQGLTDYWVSSAITQEVLDATATGIVKRISSGFLVELAVGHFVPKGSVRTSSYLLDKRMRVTGRLLNDQERAFRFLDGHVVEESPLAEAFSPSDDVLTELVAYLSPLLTEDSISLEFGLLFEGDMFVSYLIDVAEFAGDIVSDSDITTGVLSRGRASGRVVVLNEDDNAMLRGHLHDLDRSNGAVRDTVFVAKRASIDLFSLINSLTAESNCGFAFSDATFLGHPAVILRERGVPALVLPDAHVTLRAGIKVNLDTATSGLNREQRITEG